MNREVWGRERLDNSNARNMGHVGHHIQGANKALGPRARIHIVTITEPHPYPDRNKAGMARECWLFAALVIFRAGWIAAWLQVWMPSAIVAPEPRLQDWALSCFP